MTWFRVDQSVLRHPKMVRAVKRGGDGVVHLWLGLGTWSSEHLTDGIVPIDMLDQVSGPSSKRKRNDALRALIECGLVHEIADGSLELHDFLDYNPAAEVVKTERERWAQNKRKHRLGKDVPAGQPRESRVESTPCPAVPSLPSPTVSSPLREREDPPDATPPITEIRESTPSRWPSFPRGWRWSEATGAAAAMVGVGPADLQEHVDFWTLRDFPGGPVNDLDGELTRSLGDIRQRAETKRAKRAAQTKPTNHQSPPRKERTYADLVAAGEVRE